MTIYLEEEGDLKLPVDTETLAREAAEPPWMRLDVLMKQR